MSEQPALPARGVLPTRRGRLFRKYVVILVVLISGALLTSGLVEAYFVYVENEAAVVRVQSERAAAVAATIEQYLRETEHLLGWLVRPNIAADLPPEQRRLDYDGL